MQKKIGSMNRKLLSIIFILLATVCVAQADEVTFKASAPSSVILNKPFQLVYTVNASAKDLRAPELHDFDILAGPFESRSSSTQFINGKRSSSSTHTFTYTLMAKKEGTFTIPAATVSVKGNKYTSNGLKIKVLPPDETPSGEQSNDRGRVDQPSGNAISNDNLFVRTIVSKTNVYEQECIVLTYRLYTLVDVRQFTGSKFPDFTGFLKQDIDLSDNNQLTYEHYNGRNYASAILAQMLLYPQHDGDIKIDDATFDAVVRVQNRSQVRSIFDDFFDTYTNVTKTLRAPGVTIHVKSLPQGKPASYSGVVGTFDMNSSLTSSSVTTNEAITLKIEIAGSGNMKLIKSPEIEFPAGLEVYDPKVTNQFKNTSSGMSGKKTIEYLIIPRASGTYNIPSVEWSYFDTKTGAYKTLRTEAYTLNVSKGANDTVTGPVGVTYVGKEDVKQLSTDIRYIHTGPVTLTEESELLFGTWRYWLYYLVPLVLTVVLFVFFRKQIRENADIVKVKNKKANKMAQRRLKLAQKLWKEDKKEAFYEEVLKAVWNYLGDKLSMPTSSLNRDNVAGELERRSVPAELIDELVKVLDTCEYARYAPIAGENPMGELYEQVVNLISSLDEKIKK